MSQVVCVVARSQQTTLCARGVIHWCTCAEDPADVAGHTLFVAASDPTIVRWDQEDQVFVKDLGRSPKSEGMT